MTESIPRPPTLARRFPYLVLLLIGGMFFAVLLLRGLDLGFSHDSLRLVYFYQRDGIVETTRWVLDFDSRHLLSSFHYVVLQLAFPYRSWPWYAVTVGLQIMNGLAILLLWETVLGKRWRYWGLAAALLFTYHAGQRVTFFQMTVFVQMTALAAHLLALGAYARYVRGGRARVRWRDAALLLYAFGVMTYESTVLWPLAFAVIAWLLEGQHPQSLILSGAAKRAFERRENFYRVGRIIDDVWPFPLIAGFYWALVQFYHPPTWWKSFGLADSASNWVSVVFSELTPASLLREFGPAFEGPWLLLTLALVAGVSVILFLAWNRDQDDDAEGLPDEYRQKPGRNLIGGLVLGIALGVLALVPAAVAANEAFSRVVHAGTVGAALWLTGLIVAAEWLVAQKTTLPDHVRRGMAAFLCALLIAPGMTVILIERDTVAARTEIRESTLDAIQVAVPALPTDQPPYLLIIPDAHPFDLGFDAQDLRFPLFFDLRYGVNELDADMLYPAEAIPADQWPAADLDPLAYSGQALIVIDEGVVSPLVPGEVIPDERVIVLRITDGVATVLDQAEEGDLAAYNVNWRREGPLATNFDLLIDDWQ